MSGVCDVVQAADETYIEAMDMYDAYAKSALNSYIGFPNKVSRVGNPKNIEECVVLHNKIRKLLKDRLAQLGKETGYDSRVIEMFLAFTGGSYLQQETISIGDLNDISSPERLTGIYNYLKSRIAKQDRNIGKFNKGAALVREPERFIVDRDRTGRIYDLVTSIKQVPDSVQSRMYQFSTRDQEINSKFIDAITKTSDTFEGLEAYDKDNKKILIKEVLKDGYIINRYDEAGNLLPKEYKIAKNQTKVNLSDRQLIGLAQNAAQKFKEGLMDGRVRYLVPVSVRTKSDVEALKKSEDGIAIKEILDKAKEIKENGGDTYHRLHTITQGEFEFTYVMIKQGEADSKSVAEGEKYNAYIIRADNKATGKTYNLFDEGTWELNISKILQEGFYTASEDKIFNNPYQYFKLSTGEYVDKEGSRAREYYGFQKSDVNINEDVLSVMWKTVGQQRQNFDNFFLFAKNRLINLKGKVDSLVSKVDSRLKKLGMKKAEREQEIIRILHIGGVGSLLSYDENGNISLGIEHVFEKKMNYSPNRFFDSTYAHSIDAEISRIKEKIAVNKESLDEIEDEERLEKTEEYIAMLEKDLESLEVAKKSASEVYKDSLEPEEQNALKRASHMKHRKVFMNKMDRRTDGSVNNEYFSNVLNSIYHNEMKVKTMETLLDTDNKQMAKWITNYVRSSFGDASAARGLITNQQMADFLNKITFSKSFTAEKVQHLQILQNSIWTSLFLTHEASVQNNFQRANLIILYGFDLMGRARKIASGTDMDRVVNTIGTTALVNSFNDMYMEMLGEDTTIMDINYLSYTKAAAVLALPRSSFLSNKNPLNKMMFNMFTRLEAKTKSKGKLGINFTEFREFYYDLLNAGNKEEVKTASKRLKKIKSKAAMDYMRKAISWRLRWFYGGKSKYLTFQGSEELMRKEATIMACLIADELGMTEGVDNDKYLTPEVAALARSVVYNTMFGMSKAFLPDIFLGMGISGMQFKNYPYFQMLHDWKLTQNFARSQKSGAVNPFEASARLTKAIFNMTTGKKKNIREQDIDARRMAKLIAYRGTATAVGTLKFMFTPLFLNAMPSIIKKKFKKYPKSIFSSGLARGAENPVFGVAMRLLVYSLLAGSDDDDEAIVGVERLLLPPIVTVILERILKGNENKGKLTFD